MASVGAMRCALVEAYPGNERWKKRVTGMPDYRVIAIYNNMQREGRLYRHERPKPADYGYNALEAADRLSAPYSLDV